jgi:GT2 family glycosyltransferase
MSRNEGETADMDDQSCFLSVVIPCRNEVDTIRACLDAVTTAVRQLEAEIIVADGMSTDGTREVLALLSMEMKDTDVRVLDNPSGVTPVGLNVGIRAALGEYVAVISAHSLVSPRYFTSLLRVLRANPAVGCAGGVLVTSSQLQGFEAVAAAVLSSPFGVGDSKFRVGVETAEAADTAAYAVYRRTVLDEVGLFDEALVRNQDIELSYRIRRAGHTIVVDPQATVVYVPRSSLRQFCRQAFDNGAWNIVTWSLVPGSLSYRHFVPMMAVLGGALLALLSIGSVSARLLLLMISSAYVALAVASAVQAANKQGRPLLLWGVFLFPALHLSYGLGSVTGLVRLSFNRYAARG